MNIDDNSVIEFARRVNGWILKLVFKCTYIVQICTWVFIHCRNHHSDMLIYTSHVFARLQLIGSYQLLLFECACEYWHLQTRSPFLLIWINFNPSMDTLLNPLQNVRWSYSNIPELERLTSNFTHALLDIWLNIRAGKLPTVIESFYEVKVTFEGCILANSVFGTISTLRDGWSLAGFFVVIITKHGIMGYHQITSQELPSLYLRVP